MTPDMKRLCEAVWKVEADDLFGAHIGERNVDDASQADQERYEAIVRAVLTALREPTGETERYTAGEWSRRNVAAMVDDILSEPTTT